MTSFEQRSTSKQRRSLARRRQILNATLQIANAEGWPAVTTRRLADTICCSRSVIYSLSVKGV